MKIAIPGRNSRLHGVLLRTIPLSPLPASRALVFRGDRADVLLLRAWDIPTMVARGVMDAGFCGLDAVIEHDAQVEVLASYHERYNVIALCARPEARLDGNAKLVVATEYVNLATKRLAHRYLELGVLKVSGAAEAYSFCEGIDAVVDLVESGDTLAGNGLIVREVLLENSFCLVANRTVASAITPQEVCAAIAGAMAGRLT